MRSLYSQAHAAVQQATDAGRLAKAKDCACEHCGKPAHHWHHHRGYATEHHLDVIALCSSCHRAAHKEHHIDRDEVNVAVRMQRKHRAMLETLAKRRATSVSATIRQLIIEETERVAEQTLPSFTISA